mmetsp:Transcript_10317/g.24563  ORF Transcript_10317/g.24563 Transcript_10317/m.24563 type:complete len:573 (+) Transcript_10317:125-1843(+)
MVLCEIHISSEGKDCCIATCRLPKDFPDSIFLEASDGRESVSITSVGRERPVPHNLRTVELVFEASEEMVSFANSLLQGTGDCNSPEASVVKIRDSKGSRRGYILPPAEELSPKQRKLILSLGVKNREAVPHWQPSVPKRKPELRVEELEPVSKRGPVISVAGKPQKTSTCASKDTPELSIARKEETIKLRQRMAKCVEELGPLNTTTKTGYFVKRDGYFKGLAAMYGRWVFNQKSLEGSDLDPLLPHEVAVDKHQLPKELIEAGLDADSAQRVSETLSELSSQAAERMAQLAARGSAAGKVLKKRTADGQVKLSYKSTSLTISDGHYSKLCNLWDLNSSKDVDTKDEDIFCVLQRYESLSGASPGFQMALPEDVFDVLQHRWGVTHECFASPLNCYFPSYCSLFPDTDACFGSKGSFFDFFPTEGSFEANPPFVEDTMTDNIRHIEKLLDASTSPLSFVVIVPGWDDDGCESYQLTKRSKFLRTTLTLNKKEHYYKNGMQHQLQGSDVYQLSTCRTFVFFMQNDAGAARWPVCQQHIQELRSAFCSQSQPRTHVGHRDILRNASKSWYEEL